MLEAFCDLTDFPALAEQPAVQAVYAPLHGLEEQSVSGDLLTNIFAGGTVDSEWGFSPATRQHEDLRKPTDSYVWYFREQGYHTLFHHPGYSWFYNRQNVNEYLGFEESWFTENYYGALVDPVDAVMRSDETLVDGILDGSGNRAPGSPSPSAIRTTVPMRLPPPRRSSCPLATPAGRRRPATCSTTICPMSPAPWPPWSG